MCEMSQAIMAPGAKRDQIVNVIVDEGSRDTPSILRFALPIPMVNLQTLFTPAQTAFMIVAFERFGTRTMHRSPMAMLLSSCRTLRAHISARWIGPITFSAKALLLAGTITLCRIGIAFVQAGTTAMLACWSNRIATRTKTLFTELLSAFSRCNFVFGKAGRTELAATRSKRFFPAGNTEAFRKELLFPSFPSCICFGDTDLASGLSWGMRILATSIAKTLISQMCPPLGLGIGSFVRAALTQDPVWHGQLRA